ncbi:NaMN:DMB phosphoribosyltransferase [Halanaeroarchaeum sp. HSR-CO]|uniref:nicotinate-nucleotide--dimethylbenzimidazole phosphoribosyltransferase n=1 Tax=Halanaeroarchaeum sp. HSR-CO TaxID=2866382 RepID=UPI00217E088D|nr:TIGR00303 family protein [Halanaeroarchaeum sp. HSR-CO]UWG46793.1 NaMN:DMB phosphoribosyltransferase [Halanaeroarchaeum sp. HSR-CO]
MIAAFVVGTTATGRIDGLSAAGASPAVMRHTPAADAEIVTYGRPVFAPSVPVSPEGCPTPSLVTRAALDRLSVETMVLDAGLATRTAAPTVEVGVSPGDDLRAERPVPNADAAFEAGARVGRAITHDEMLVAESIPGGTTTAMGVLTALGEPNGVSSSLPENPLERKRSVVDAGLAASEVGPGELAGQPIEAVERMGDPVLATIAGLVTGAAAEGVAVTLAGGSQMVAAAALARHGGVDAPLSIATTAFVEWDDSFDLHGAADALDLSTRVTDPGFEAVDHVAFERYRLGEAKEGVGMGGALWLADREGVPMAAVRDRIVDYYDRLVGEDGPR